MPCRDIDDANVLFSADKFLICAVIKDDKLFRAGVGLTKETLYALFEQPEVVGGAVVSWTQPAYARIGFFFHRRLRLFCA